MIVRSQDLFSQLRANGRLVVLSPHLDDAALSLGASIAGLSSRLRRRPLVITAFTGETPNKSPTSAELLRRWNVSGYSQRIEEDRSAMEILGTEALHLPGMETMFRHPMSGLSDVFRCEPLCNECRSALDTLEQHLREALAPEDICLIPAGLAPHVDHYISFLAATNVLKGRHYVLYQELPYCDRLGTPSNVHHLVVSADDLQVKLSALRCYSSQVGELERDFGSLDDLVWRTAANGMGGPPFSEKIWMST